MLTQERARQVRCSIRRLCQLFQQPSISSWNAAASELRSALESLVALEHEMRAGAPRASALVSEISALRRDVAQAQALLVSAGRFYQGLAALVEQQETQPIVHYTPRGPAAPPLSLAPGKVLVHG